jgi:omega-6 fatty acid desaturase (delta-12 desaturase)
MNRGNPDAAALPHWKEVVARYRRSSGWRAGWQLVNTLLPYVALWIAMPWLASISWWLVLPAAALAAGFQVRLFIIFHDCGHGSFFSSQRANRIVGFIAGVLTFVPSQHWWAEHARHHASSGNLDKRGTGDIWTLTVQEYLRSSRWRRIAYRLSRNPVVLFVLAPFFLFVVLQRFPSREASPRERRSVHLTNLAIVGLAAVLSWAMGFSTYLILQGMITAIAGTAGVWLFYVQHQFEGVYWRRGEEWDYAAAALHGSSFYKLPKLLQWFSGNIGFHHIHHLSPGVPNYHLERCHASSPLFADVTPITLWSSLRSLQHRLWDEGGGRLVGYPRRK